MHSATMITFKCTHKILKISNKNVFKYKTLNKIIDFLFSVLNGQAFWQDREYPATRPPPPPHHSTGSAAHFSRENLNFSHFLQKIFNACELELLRSFVWFNNSLCQVNFYYCYLHMFCLTRKLSTLFSVF